MRKSLLTISFAVFIIFQALAANRYWVSSAAGNWNNTANWSTASGGAGGASVPGAADVAIFDGGGGKNGNCSLDMAPTVGGMSVITSYTGTIDLSGNTLIVTGTATYAKGTITNSGAAASVSLNATSVTFSGTVFSADITGSSGAILFNGSTFNNPVNVTKTGASTDNSTGGNIFNGATTITNNGGQIQLGNTNRDQFNSVTTFNNNGTYRFYFANGHTGQTTTFASNVTLNTNKSGGGDAWSFFVCEGANTSVSFGGNVTINCAGSLQSNHRFLQGAGSTAVFSGSVTINLTNTSGNSLIQMGTNGVSTYNGNIVVNNSGSASGISFNANATASSTMSSGNTISIGAGGFSNGALTLTRFVQTGSTAQTLNTFSGTAALVLGPNSSFGGNVNFVAPTMLLNGVTISGTAYIEKNGSSSDTGAGGNIFNGVTTIVNSGSGYLLLGNTNRDQFNASTTFNITGDYRIYFAYGHAGQTTTFASDVTLNANKSGGADAWSFFVCEGANTSVSFGGNLTINCNGSIQSNIRFLNGSGSTATFSGTTTINLTNSSAGTSIFMGDNGTSAYNGNIIVNNSSAAGGIYFNNRSGSSTLAATNTISIGAGGFTGGTLSLPRFTQLGSAPVTLSTFTGTSSLVVGPSSAIGGNVNFVAPQVFLQGCTYGGTAYIEKNGASQNTCTGGNTFNSTVTLVDSGTGTLIMANASPDTFNGTLTVENPGSANILLAQTAAGTQFNGNVILSQPNPGTGIYFGNNGGTSIMSAGNTISIGAGGYSSGVLNIVNFTQNGSAAMNLTLTGTATLTVGPNTTIGGNVSFVSPHVFLNGATYQGSTIYIEKNGAGADASTGNNTFQGTTTIVNSGSNYLLMGNSFPDTFNGDVTFTNTGSNYIYLAYNSTGNQFNGNIIVNCTGGNGIIFSAAASGTSTLANGKTISVGAFGFNTAQLQLVRFTQLGGTAQNLTLTGTALLTLGPSSTFNGNVNFVAPQVWLNGTTYNGTAYIEKNGATDNAGNGGNIFNSTSTLVCSGSGYLMTGNVTADVFNGDATFTNTGSRMIYLGYNSANNQFNGNIIVNSTSGNGVYFSAAASGSSILASGKTISVGGSGFTFGSLILQNFTQLSSTPQSLTLTNVAALTMGPNSTFNGNVNFVAPQVYLNGTTYNGTVYIEKNGATNNAGNGGNVFNSTSTLVCSGSGYLMTGNVTADVFNGDATFTNIGSNIIYLGYNSANNQFNGNIIVNSTSGNGVYFSTTASGSSILASGKTISVGGSGFTFGSLILKNFTQLSSTPQSLTLTNVAALTVGPNSTFNGNVTFTTPTINLNGCTYNGTASITKTGTTNDTSLGGNIFNSTASFTNSGTGQFINAGSGLDTFNNDLALTNTGISSISMSQTTSGTQFNGNIIVNCNNGVGIYFGNNGGTSSMASGKTVSIGGTGFSAGELRFYQFTQLGSTAQNLTLTGTASLRIGNSSVFNGNVNFTSPQLYLDGATYNGTATLTKNGAGYNSGSGNNVFATTTTITNDVTSSAQLRTNGNNTFNGTTFIINNSPADLLLELTTGSTYNGDVTFTNTGSSYVRVAYTGGNSFNGNITVNSTNGLGVYFCENPAGTATLATGKTISVGGTGFSAGSLVLQRFTQNGSTAQNVTLTGTSTIFQTGPSSTWNGNLTVSSPSIFLNGAIFNGTSSFTKTGTVTDASTGGNTFAGATTFTNSAIGVFRLANTSGDTFGSSATFNQTSGTIQPAYASTSTFAGDINVISSSTITFGAGVGIVTFNGSGGNQNVNANTVPQINRLMMNTSSGGTVTLNSIVNVGVSGTFTAGVMNTTAANYLNFANNATTTGASNSSYVNGPVRKTGNQAFIFPVGNAGVFRSIAISAPGLVTDAFTAQLFRSAQAYGGAATYQLPILTVSSCEYWILNRSNGASNVSVTLSWNSPDCSGPYVTDITKLLVSRWNGTNWVSHGNGGTTGNATTGTVISSAAVTSFSPFALASSSLVNPLPITLTYFNAALKNGVAKIDWETESELNNDFYTLERSADGAVFEQIYTIKGAGTTSQPSYYSYLDENPLSGISYYRLKQTDFDKQQKIVAVASIENKGVGFEFSIYPNPASPEDKVNSNFSGGATVYNSIGQPVLQLTNASEINVSSLSSGVYIIRTITGQAQRLVVK